MGVHTKMAEDCWHMIKALGSTDGGPPDEDLDAAAITLIEMACDSAMESARVALGHPPKCVGDGFVGPGAASPFTEEPTE